MPAQVMAQRDAVADAGAGAEPDGDSFAAVVAEVLGDRAAAWTLRRDDTWLRVLPAGVALRAQGWKVHLSATGASAPEVLRRAAVVLADEVCAFKVAADHDVLAALNGPRTPRGSAGKFLTVYPADDEQLRRVALRLDEATAGLPGPQILSDRRLRPGSLVHLRYGTFAGRAAVSDDGEVQTLLVAPDGTEVEDRREARFAPPSWAPDISALFAAPAARPAGPAPTAVLLGERFVVRSAIRHANKGGVFRAVDQRTGAEAVVKQARAHVGAGRELPDVRALLRHEAALLHRLEPLRRTPRLLATFAQDEDEFLAEEYVDAPPLRSWIGARWTDGVPGCPPATLLAVAVDIAEMLAGIHRAGVVVRDLSPNNVLVDADGRAWLVDLELAAEVGTLPPGERPGSGRGSGTPAYSAPEQLAGAAPDRSADLWSLGALLCMLFTGEDPFVDPASVAADSPAGLVRHWRSAPPRRRLVPPAIGAIVDGLLRDDPTARTDAATVARALHRVQLPAAPPTAAELSALTLTRLTADPDRTSRLSEELLDGILAGVRDDDRRRWPSTSFGETTDPANVQHGAAGVLGALVQASRVTGDARVRAEVAATARWLAGRVRVGRRGPVGLYFGVSGAAWALADAADHLADDGLRAVATELALGLPADWSGPDLTHGRAGLGLTLLHLAERAAPAEAEALRSAAARVADGLVRDVTRDADGSVSWRTPRDARSSFAGRRFHGFAHGTAGIGLFLLEAGRVLGREDCTGLAAAAVDTLLRAALPQPDGTVAWGSGPEEPHPTPAYWCNGAGGIGTFLVHAYAAAGDERLPDVVDRAARAVMAGKWRMGVAYCHGLAGNADFLLDAADVLDAPEYRDWAADLAVRIADRAVHDAGRLAVGDEPGRITPDFNVGGAGALSFLLRQRAGGPRLWLPAPAGTERAR
jgi:serine/threonine protein kinase